MGSSCRDISDRTPRAAKKSGCTNLQMDRIRRQQVHRSPTRRSPRNFLNHNRFQVSILPDGDFLSQHRVLPSISTRLMPCHGGSKWREIESLETKIKCNTCGSPSRASELPPSFLLRNVISSRSRCCPRRIPDCRTPEGSSSPGPPEACHRDNKTSSSCRSLPCQSHQMLAQPLIMSNHKIETPKFSLSLSDSPLKDLPNIFSHFILLWT